VARAFDRETIDLPDPLTCPSCAKTAPISSFGFAEESDSRASSAYLGINTFLVCPTCGHKQQCGHYLEDSD
jgi:hypothetical protein